ncbi:MAG TPA: hypothetical protein EYP06_03155 [Desulfobacterales bacterium]|nr:hypothetical protein [Desulfobacterales bacterium]
MAGILRVKLYGTLSKLVQDYDGTKGLELEIPDKPCLKDILEILGIPEDRKVVGVINGRIIGPQEALPDEATLTLLEAASGG